MTTIPTYEQACEAKHAGAPQPKMAAGQYWYNQFGVLWKITSKVRCKLGNVSFIAKVFGSDKTDLVELENYDSIIYAGADPHLNESEQ